jgi:hypothetical protein
MSVRTFVERRWTNVKGRITRFFTYVGGAVTIYAGYHVYRANFEEAYLYPDAILYLNLNNYAMADSTSSRLALLQSLKTFQDVIESVKIAKDDPHVHGLVVNLSRLGTISLAQTQELSQVIKDFSQQGKKLSVAYSDNFGKYVTAMKARNTTDFS